jgi:AcrR family transcriptional regulator
MAIETTRTDARSSRMPAAERRAQIVAAAAAEFAVRGLHGTSSEDIARAAGITQPYIFRLFGTKKALFIAVVESTFDEVQSRFQRAIDGSEKRDSESLLMAMGLAYGELLSDRTLLLMQMQCYAACDDPEVRAVVQRRYGELFRWAQRASAANQEQMHTFFANGMLLNVAAAIDLPSVGEDWVADCLGASLAKL